STSWPSPTAVASTHSRRRWPSTTRTSRSTAISDAPVTAHPGDWPTPADFAGPPTAADHARWEESDRVARAARQARLRARFAAAAVGAYFGIRREHMRYLTGFALADGEEKVAGTSGQFVVGGEEVVILADSRYTIQARREAPGSRLFEAYNDLPS